MITLRELAALRDKDIEKTDRSSLVNLEEINTDPSLAPPQRMLSYLEQIKNPYCFLCGDTPVKVCFSFENTDLGQILRDYFWGLKR